MAGVPSNAAVTYTTVAVSGSAGANLGFGPNLGPGITFQSFDSWPMLNSSGVVAFRARVAGSGTNPGFNLGIWSYDGNTLQAVARAGSAGPLPNVEAGMNTFAGMGEPVLNDDGMVAFVGSLDSDITTSTKNSGIWTNASGSLAVVAREGTPGPGPNLGSQITYSDFIDVNPVFNTAGKVAFHADITVNGVTNTTGNYTGFWSNATGSLALVARGGTAGTNPQVGAGNNFYDFEDPVLNDAGKVAFKASLALGDSGTLVGSGIWSNVGGTLQPVASTQGVGPGPGLGVGVSFAGLDKPIINNDGKIAFSARVSGTGIHGGNDTGI